MEIKFTNTGNAPEQYAPKPATESVPDWYKNLESYMTGKKQPTGQGVTSATIKRCMPVFDAITGGYIIYTPADVFVSQKDGAPWYEWAALEPIQFHPIEQAPSHPNANGFSYPKWINPWAIKTPKGYSVLFVQPMHRESTFSILSGVVDTDKYTAPVNFPFVLNDPQFEGLIPAGTPIAQIIPFKRDNWKLSFGNEKDLVDQSKVTLFLRTSFFDSYKNKFRTKKEYK